MNVTIYGGGNIGTQLAIHFAEGKSKGLFTKVIVFTSKPERFSNHLTIVDHQGNILHQGEIDRATNNPNEAFADADLILVTVPSFMMETASKTITPFSRPGLKIGIIPGNGGGEVTFQQAIKRGATLFGLQRVPSVARLVEYGKSVCATGYRRTLYVASLPSKNTSEICNIISKGIGLECLPLKDYLNLTLTPSNPILHTTRLMTLFKDYVPGKTIYPHLPLFYEEWSDETTELLFKCDEEVQNLCRLLTEYDLSGVESLKVHYENDTVSGFTNKIRSIEGFKGLPTPSVKVDGGYMPDLDSRYFTADFNYGLYVILQVAELNGVYMPNCKSVFDWYQKIKKPGYGEFSYRKFGIVNKKTFDDFYKL